MRDFKMLVWVFIHSLTLSLSAQVYISEYSASNLNQFIDNYGKYEDWIEIYNTAPTDIDISGWGLSDKLTKPLKWTFPQGTVIKSNEYILVWCSGRDELLDGHYHTDFKLSQTKNNEYVVLSKPDETIVSSSPLQLTLLGHSRIFMEEENNWQIDTQPNPGERGDLSSIKKGYTSEPFLNLEAGNYAGKQVIEISSINEDEIIRYTLDGNAPTALSNIYTEPIEISTTTVVKARCFSADTMLIPGKIVFASYFIDEDISVPFFSVAADRIQDLANGDKELRPIGSIEYFSPEGELIARSYGELNSHGQDSWINPHKSLDWVSRDEMGYSRTVEAPLFNYTERNDYQRFMFRASGDDNYPAIDDQDHQYSCHIRDEYVHELAQSGDMKLDVRAVERAVLFLNGDYWGLYSIRERPVDHDFIEYNYDQDKYHIQYLLTWGNTWAEYGGNEAFYDWLELRDFILDNDMSISENYQRVKDEIQLKGLIDYMIVNLNVVSVDWLNYNTGWWRGIDPDGDHKKWGYMLWDNDATFDYYINYTGVPNKDPDALPCDINEISVAMDDFFSPDEPEENNIEDPENCNTISNGSSPYPATDSIYVQVVNADIYCCNTQWDEVCQESYDAILELQGGEGGLVGIDPTTNIGKHEKIFLKLQEESDEFRQLYYSRQADLINTVFSCENMNAKLDSLLAIMTPEMPRQIERWGGSIQEWESNIGRLRDFVNARCQFLAEGMTSCFDITGPYPISFKTFPAGVGKIDLNTIKLNSFPWTGNYFGNMDNLIEAKSTDDDYQFVRWESVSSNTVFDDIGAADTKAMISGMDTIIAVFDLISSTAPVLPIDVASFEVFPTPTHDVATIRYTLEDPSSTRLELLNSYGQILWAQNYTQPVVEHIINLKELGITAGMYTLQLHSAKGSTSKRLMYVQ